MPATPSRIGFITNQFRRAISGPDSDVVTRYGALARDNDDPVETFFDDTDDAQAIADERLALLSASRRMLTIGVAGAQAGMDVAYNPALATAAVIDDERSYEADALVVAISIDLETETSEFQTWG